MSKYLAVTWRDKRTDGVFTSYYEYAPDGSQVVVSITLMPPEKAIRYTEVFGGPIVNVLNTDRIRFTR